MAAGVVDADNLHHHLRHQAPEAEMKALVISTSRADRNGQEAVAAALSQAGHETRFYQINSGHWRLLDDLPDVAVVAGDRAEMLETCIVLA